MVGCQAIPLLMLIFATASRVVKKEAKRAPPDRKMLDRKIK
jgi:hypothetical protein